MGSHNLSTSSSLKRDIMERFHILGRGSIERTKIIIDKVITLRGMLPEFLPKNPKILKDFNILLDNMLITTLPKLNSCDNTRIILFRLMNENFEDIDFLDLAKWGCFIVETRLHYEYTFSDRIIIDFKNIKASLITKINPIVVKKTEVLFTEAYKIKVKGIHVINGPPFINKIASIFKQILKEKVGSRIHIHNSYEELYQQIPREVLPKDYGGEQANCSDLAEQWKEYFKTEDVKHIIENSIKLVSNESRRSSIKFNEEYLGMTGSFKQLNLD